MEKVIRKLKEAKERVVKFINGYDTRTKVVAGVASAIVLVLTASTVIALATEDAPVAAATDEAFESVDIINTESEDTAEAEEKSKDRGFKSNENEDKDTSIESATTADATTESNTVTLPDAETTNTASSNSDPEANESKSSNNSSSDNNNSNSGNGGSNSNDNNKNEDITWIAVYATRTVKEAWDEPLYENQPVYKEVPVVCSDMHYINPGQTSKCSGLHMIDKSDGTDINLAYDKYLVSGPYKYGDSASNPMPYSSWASSYNHTDWYHEQEIVGYEKIQTGTEKVQVDTIHHPAVTEEFIDYYYNKANPSQKKAGEDGDI